MDDIDRAQQYDEQYRQQAIHAHYSGLSPAEQQPVTGECIDCGNPIEPKRRELVPNAGRCVACQTKFERFNGRRS